MTLIIAAVLSPAAFADASGARCELDGTYIARNNSGKDAGVRIKGEHTCAAKSELRAFYSKGKKKHAYFREVQTADGKRLWIADSGIKVAGPVADVVVDAVEPRVQEPTPQVDIREAAVASPKVDRLSVVEDQPKIEIQPKPDVDTVKGDVVIGPASEKPEPVVEIPKPAEKPKQEVVIAGDKSDRVEAVQPKLVDGQYLVAPKDIFLYDLNSEGFGVRTGKSLDSGDRFKLLSLNKNNSKIQLENGKIRYVKRADLEKHFTDQMLDSDSETEAVSGLDCANNANCPQRRKYKENVFAEILNGGLGVPDIDWRLCGVKGTNANDAKPISKDPLTALACNNYNEGGNESFESMKMICKVVLARVESPGFPKTIPGVVYEKDQFSWAYYKPDGVTRKLNGGKQKPGLFGKAKWNKAIKAAVECLEEGAKVNGRLWTHYYGDYVRPRWRFSSNCTAPTRLVSGSKHYFLSCNGMPDGKGRAPATSIAKKKGKKGKAS